MLFRYGTQWSFRSSRTWSLFLFLIIFDSFESSLIMMVGSSWGWFTVRIIIGMGNVVIVPLIIEPMRAFHQNQKSLQAIRIHRVNLHNMIFKFSILSIWFLTEWARCRARRILGGIIGGLVFILRRSLLIFLAFGVICKGGNERLYIHTYTTTSPKIWSQMCRGIII